MKKWIMLVAMAIAPFVYAEKFEANWESLSAHEAAPEWLKDAKLGIYFHWGPYSVPAHGSEWYPNQMHRKDRPTYQHHVDTYGDPSEFGYHDFIPDFTGEHFDPEDWAELFVQAGAKFAGPVAEHHDGYSMWASKITPWNAKDTGPHRDILGDLFKSLEARDMKTIATFHHSRNLAGRGGHYPAGDEGWPTRSDDPKLQMLYGNMPAEAWYETVWMGKLVEVIDNYQPDIIWFDSWLDRLPESYRQRFCAYYLNEAEQWGKEVAIVRKQEDLPINFTMLDFEQSRSANALPDLWMTDDTITTGSWCYTKGIKLKPVARIVHGIIDTAAKNGVTLFNISPKADGSIPQNQRETLLGMGAWLKANGEAIYGTRAWTIAAEGPTVEPEGGYHDRQAFINMDYSAKDIRFTRNQENTTLYAIPLGWPGEKLFIQSLKGFGLGSIKSVMLLGVDQELQWTRAEGGMEITMPEQPAYGVAYPVRIEFDGLIEVPKN